MANVLSQAINSVLPSVYSWPIARSTLRRTVTIAGHTEFLSQFNSFGQSFSQLASLSFRNPHVTLSRRVSLSKLPKPCPPSVDNQSSPGISRMNSQRLSRIMNMKYKLFHRQAISAAGSTVSRALSGMAVATSDARSLARHCR